MDDDEEFYIGLFILAGVGALIFLLAWALNG